jgi:Sodium:solute symporter family
MWVVQSLCGTVPGLVGGLRHQSESKATEFFLEKFNTSLFQHSFRCLRPSLYLGAGHWRISSLAQGQRGQSEHGSAIFVAAHPEGRHSVGSTLRSYPQLVGKAFVDSSALWIFLFGVIILMFICCYTGLLIYASYQNCDPLTTKLAQAKDQLLPLYVMDILGEYPGLPGLFVAGVFSAALSSLSTGLNSMSAVVLEDFFKPFTKTNLTERQTG